MTDLNTSLWAAGAALILLVVLYNFWQEYKAKKKVQRAFGEHRDDVLMKTETSADADVLQRHEPSLDEPELDNHAEPASAPDLIGTPDAPETALLPIDEFIDCVFTIDFDSPVRGERLLGETQGIRIAGNKPVHFVGQTGAGQYELIQHAGSYTQLQAGVLLVNRSGALNELEFSEMVMKLRQIADNLNGFLDVPDMKQVMDAARDLAVFVSEHDAQLSVNVRSKGAPWEIATLIGALEKLGFDSRPDGRLVMLDGEGGALFTLMLAVSPADTVTGRITLLLDVPCVSARRGGFAAMVSCAKSLALRLGGILVDDGDTPLDDATLNQIQQQVEAFYGQMQGAEIPAGSSRALRLFS